MKYGGLVLDVDSFKYLDKEKFLDKLKVLKCLVDKEIPVVLYTDGDCKIVRNIMHSLKIKEPAVVMEGARVYSPFQCEHDFNIHLAIKTVKELCMWAKEKDICFELITDRGKIDYEKWLMEVKSFLVNCRINDCPNVLEVVMNITNKNIHDELSKFISQNHLECYSHVYEYQEVFINSRVDKGITLRCLSKKKNWDLKNFIAIGQYPKDTSLFEEVGLGIAVHDENVGNMKSIEISNKINVLEECINNYF